MASYFGLTVEVLWKMQHYALIRFDEREFVVDACDLGFIHQSLRAA